MQNQDKIVQMFDKIAPSYDLANRVLSFGVDKAWRKYAVDFLLSKYSKQKINIVDMACGTGDMIEFWLNRAKKFDIQIEKIIGVDPSIGMLQIAKTKFQKYLQASFINSLAHESNCDSSMANIISISYGIRNVQERQKTLMEFNRILNMNGYLLVLEFTKRDKQGFASNVRDFYLNKILPKIGGFISKDKQAYEYLPQSIENFLDANEFKNELIQSGFQVEMVRAFSFNISTMFVARKIRTI